MRGTRAGALLLALAATSGAYAVRLQAQARPPCRLVVAANGSVSVRFGGRSYGAIEPGLFEADWRHAGLGGATGAGSTAPNDPRRAIIRAQSGGVVDTALTTAKHAEGVLLSYRLTPRTDLHLNSLHVAWTVPAELLAGGSYEADGTVGAFPREFGIVGLRSAATAVLRCTGRNGATLLWRFTNPTPVLLQDDRQWGQTFSVRIGPQLDGGTVWPAGKALSLDIVLACETGMEVEMDEPVTLQADSQWIPLDQELDIEPGSALDFAKLVPWHAPAGRLGRVVRASGGGMAFASRPSEPVRFYGANLCFSAQYLTHEQSDRLADRLARIGYNAVRLHHYESMLVDRSGRKSTVLNAERLDELDYLFAALKRRGIYVTTDLFVSRQVLASEVWPGETGDVGMDEFKMAIPVNDRAFANYREFAGALLTHRNPYTGQTWGSDAALAWLSLINEGNPGNFIGSLTPRLRADWVRAWEAWLARKHASASDRAALLGGEPASTLPPNGQAARAAFEQFLADNQRSLTARSRAFLKEFGCQAMVTNLNAWTNPAQMHAVRTGFDYVDDHFYVDHPEFVEQPWQLPSRCPNASPVAQGAPGGRSGAFLRLFGMPYTVSEYNYSGPGRFRGVGGILTGSLGAIQDWSVIWRFAYSHTRDNLFTAGPAGYFDCASDPLNLAAERASICLFRRGDLAPSKHRVAIRLPGTGPSEHPAGPSGGVAPPWHGLAWVTRVGTIVGEPQAGEADLVVDGRRGSAASPYSAGAGEGVLAELRKRGWLAADNRTSLATQVLQNENGQFTLDAPADTLTIDTPRTAGGYAPEGATIVTKAVTIKVDRTDAAVWVSAIDGRPIGSSRRMLVTHLTDLQNTGVRYGDRDRKLLLAWGGLPHLVLDGAAAIRLRVARPETAHVWGLSVGGRRLAPVPCTVDDGLLEIPLRVSADGKARMLYEVEVGG